MTTDTKTAFLRIEDDVLLLEASAGALHLAFHDLDEDGKGTSALAQTVWLAAKTIEDACWRIRKLGDHQPDAEPHCGPSLFAESEM